MPCNVDPALIRLCNNGYDADAIFASDIATRKTIRLTPKGRDLIHAALGLPKGRGHFPADYSASASLAGFSFTVRTGVKSEPSQRRLPFGHRVMALCPTCERWIPVGRMAQHAGKYLGRRKRSETTGRFMSPMAR